jgi:hypothetical protein
MSKGKVLVIGSNDTRIEVQGGGTGATGQYLDETVVPAMALVEAGYDVVLATPNGAKPHIDEASDSAEHFRGDEEAYRRARAFFDDDPSMNPGRTLRSVIAEGLDNYAAIFVPGGQAPVVDLMQDPEVGEIVRHFHDRKKPRRLTSCRSAATTSTWGLSVIASTSHCSRVSHANRPFTAHSGEATPTCAKSWLSPRKARSAIRLRPSRSIRSTNISICFGLEGSSGGQ